MRSARAHLLAGALWSCLLPVGAAIPAPEQLLPQDTLALVTAPDFGRMREAYRNWPQTKLWEDPAMKPLRDRFIARWQEEFVRPLERELNVSFDTYASLPQGQLTFALIQNGWQGTDDHPLGFVLLLDAKDKSAVLRTNLAELRKNWIDAGKIIRRETIRGVEFSIYPVSSNNLPKTIRKFFPAPYQYSAPPGEVGSKTASEPTAGKLGPLFDTVSAMLAASTELVVGQIDSLLIVGNSVLSVEKVATRLTGGAMPPLTEVAAYQANQDSLFRGAPFYAWINTKLFVDILSHKPADKTDSETPDPLEAIKPDAFFSVTGLNGLRSAAFTLHVSNEGYLFEVVGAAPESAREGLLKILTGEAKDTVPPAFVPADAVKFWRARLDAPKTWSMLENMLEEGSPQTLNTLNWILDTASARAKEKDPGFDLKKTLVSNLGNDFICYERPPRDESADPGSPPSLMLIGSPSPDLLAAALKGLFVIFPEGDTMSEREFLGRKILSVPLPGLPVSVPGVTRPAMPKTLSFAASASYVALSTDAAMLEEFLRSSDSPPRALREKPGLLEAAQKVGGLGTSLFGYENLEETMRAAFEKVRRDPTAAASLPSFSPLPGLPGLTSATPDKNFKGWLDPALLPPFDKIASYFWFSVYGASASTDGLRLKFFTPVRPNLHNSETAR